MGLLVLFFYRSDYVQGLVANMGAAGPLMFVVGMIGVQGVVEAVLGCAVGAARHPAAAARGGGESSQNRPVNPLRPPHPLAGRNFFTVARPPPQGPM